MRHHVCIFSYGVSVGYDEMVGDPLGAELDVGAELGGEVVGAELDVGAGVEVSGRITSSTT